MTIKLWQCLAIVILIEIRRQIQYPLRLLTNKNIISMSKIKIVAYKLCPHSILTFRDYIYGALFVQSPLISPIIAHRHLCFEIFEGKNSANMDIKNVCDRMLSKCWIENISKTF